MNILEKIIVEKRKEVLQRSSEISVTSLEQMPLFKRDCYPLIDSLKDPQKNSVIAEFKRKSPSKGWINQDANVIEVTQGYTLNKASALSVLTDELFFGGNLLDLEQARRNEIPILRKDFIIDEYQVIESKAYGADVILLIAACLSKAQILQFSKTAKGLGLSVLLEVHTEPELEVICDSIDVVGINNRDLKTFLVDIENSIRLAEKIPEICKISESGLHDFKTLEFLQSKGFDGFLIGERFMKEKNPVKAFTKFLNRQDEN